MSPRFLLDTHVLVRWLTTPKKLSREQLRVLRDAVRRRESVAVSAITLLELAVLFGRDGARGALPAATFLEQISANPAFQLVPMTIEIAAEASALGDSLRDPADRALVATARVGRLKLLTSDQRIIDSGLVPVIA